MKRILGLWINGRWREEAVAENALLLDYLRDGLGLTGTKQGCDGGECGACTVLVDERAAPGLLHAVAQHAPDAASRRSKASPPKATFRACSGPFTKNSAPSAASARRA